MNFEPGLATRYLHILKKLFTRYETFTTENLVQNKSSLCDETIAMLDIEPLHFTGDDVCWKNLNVKVKQQKKLQTKA